MTTLRSLAGDGSLWTYRSPLFPLPLSSLSFQNSWASLTPPLQVEKSKAELAKAEGKFDQYRKETGAKIDAADRKIENKAAEAKSGISSWFGGK